MTKKELIELKKLKENYLNWNRENGFKCEERKSEIFHKMKQLSNDLGLPMWCSMSMLLKQLIGTKYEDRAISYFEEYNECEGRINSLHDFLISTNNLSIVKEV